MTTKLKLAQAALALRARDASVWSEFLAALETHAADVRDRILNCPRDELSRLQGQAQACATLLDDLKNAARTVEQVAAKKGTL